VQGTDNGDGTWSSPHGASTAWVAFDINNIIPDRSISTDPWLQTYGMTVQNDTNVG
jgi:hypothetical protein